MDACVHFNDTYIPANVKRISPETPKNTHLRNVLQNIFTKNFISRILLRAVNLANCRHWYPNNCIVWPLARCLSRETCDEKFDSQLMLYEIFFAKNFFHKQKQAERKNWLSRGNRGANRNGARCNAGLLLFLDQHMCRRNVRGWGQCLRVYARTHATFRKYLHKIFSS